MNWYYGIVYLSSLEFAMVVLILIAAYSVRHRDVAGAASFAIFASMAPEARSSLFSIVIELLKPRTSRRTCAFYLSGIPVVLFLLSSTPERIYPSLPYE